MAGLVRVWSQRAALAFWVSLACACAADAVNEPNRSANPTPTTLAEKLPEGAVPVGLAITPAGERYVLDRNSGLYHVADEGAELVFATTDLDIRFGLSPALELTDVASIAERRFLLTAENDGFLLDLELGTFESYFCYLPSIDEEQATPPSPPQEPIDFPPPLEDVGDQPPPPVLSISQVLSAQGVAVKQRTESVAYNPTTQSLLAQPRTVRLDTQEVVGSEVFQFANTGGSPIRVQAIADAQFLAGGMVTHDSSVILGRGNQLYEVGLGTEPVLVQTLAAEVVIAGMARDVDGSLVILDATTSGLISLAQPGG